MRGSDTGDPKKKHAHTLYLERERVTQRVDVVGRSAPKKGEQHGDGKVVK